MAFSNGLRSTLGKNMVNEATVAYSWDPVQFFPEEVVGMFTGSVANQQGFNIGFPSVDSNLTGPNAATPAPQSRNATTLDITNNVTWLKGSHSITLGGQVSAYHVWLKNASVVPSLGFGVQAADPAFGLFSAANFPGSSTAQQTAASNLFALLTGRVNTISADARLDASGKRASTKASASRKARSRKARATSRISGASSRT